MTTTKKILVWTAVTSALLTIIILLSVYWGSIATWWSGLIGDLHLPIALWMAVVGIVAITGFAWLVYRFLGGLTGVLRFLSGLAAIAYIIYVIRVHTAVNEVVFNAYFYSTANLAIILSIVGVGLIAWLLSDGTTDIPWRKILAVVIGLLIIFMLGHFFLPMFGNLSPDSKSIKEEVLLFAKTHWYVTVAAGLALLLILLCIFKGTREKASEMLTLLAGVSVIGLIAWAVMHNLGSTKAYGGKAERPEVLTEKYIVSNQEATRIPWPDDRFYKNREVKPGRPMPIMYFIQNEKPEPGDPFWVIKPDERLKGKESREPLWVVVADTSGEEIKIEIEMEYTPKRR